MNALPNPVHLAIRGLCAPATDTDRIQFLEAECRRLRTRLDSDMRPAVLREPFEYEVCTREAVCSWGWSGCEAEYTTVAARDESVLKAVDWLIEQHMGELEAKVAELEKQP
jgi:hypothetical protein